MKLSEILRVPPQQFPKEKVEEFLHDSIKNDGGPFDFPYEPGLSYYFMGYDTGTKVIILTDSDKNIAAFSGFISRMNGTVWQAKNVSSYPPYYGRNLAAKMYKFVKTNIGKHIQSDVEQSEDGERIWTNSLPKIGLQPKIFDTEREQIIDHEIAPNEYEYARKNMYINDPSNPIAKRFTWILENRTENYPAGYTDTCILREGVGHLLPYKAIFYNFNLENQ
jgi:hypothetical protein